jgi:HEAT repeat protein
LRSTSDLMDLEHGDLLNMWEAAKRLANDGDLAIVPKLLELLTSASEPDRRVAAGWVLGFMRASAALEPLMQLLDDQSQPPPLRDQAAESIGYLSDPTARDVLIRHLQDEHPDVVFSCVFALRTVGAAEDIPHLAAIAATSRKTTSQGRSIAAEAGEAIDQIQARLEREDG